MPLTLSVRSVERAGTSPPPPLRLEGRGAVIGRAPGTDWTLPDDRNTVSSRHCEIGFRAGAYLVADTSTNGTWVNGSRLTAPHQIRDGDVLRVGPYEIAASLVAAPQSARTMQAPAPDASASVDQLLRAAGLNRAEVPGSDADILAAAGGALREMAAGADMLLDRAARARKEIGVADAPAASTIPLPELLAGQRTGAVSAAFTEIEAHQLATLKAMQGAMKATLDRISPAAIRTRSAGKGDAALWQDYERAFTSGDDSFAEVFTREFRTAYEALAKRAAKTG